MRVMARMRGNSLSVRMCMRMISTLRQTKITSRRRIEYTTEDTSLFCQNREWQSYYLDHSKMIRHSDYLVEKNFPLTKKCKMNNY